MAIQTFRGRDLDYTSWRETHIDGFVVNVDESNPTGTRIHKASCVTLQLPIDKGQDLTGPYPKVCSGDAMELRRETGNPRACPVCSP